MKSGIAVVSADDHVIEAPELWTSRLPTKWVEQAPRRETLGGSGRHAWKVDGRTYSVPDLAGGSAASEPAERLKAMDQDGIAAQVLYPTAAGVGGQVLGAIQDPDLSIACIEAYNDWLLETWGRASGRFVPQCVVPISSVEAACKEARRSVALGHRGIIMPPAPMHLRPGAPHIHDSRWDPFWATAQDLGVPVCWHAGADSAILLPLYAGFTAAQARAFEMVRGPIASAQPLVFFLLSGIGERFPRLRMVFADTTIAWVPSQLELCEHQARKAMLREREGMQVGPTEIFQRQCYVSMSFDRAGLELRTAIGVENILWHSEFPLPTTTYPGSRQLIERTFAGIPEAERDRILHGNAARLYRLPSIKG